MINPISVLKFVRLLVTCCLSGLLISGCRQATRPEQAGAQGAPGDSRHKVVEVDWQARLAATQRQLEREPNSSFLHGQAAVAYDALGDFMNFDSEIQAAMRLAPENSMPCYIAYAVYKRRHFNNKRATVLDEALKIDQDNPFGHYEKAAMLEDAKDWQGALKEYETAQRLLQRVKSDPSNLQQNSWSYVDGLGNPYDVTFQESHIADDIARVHAAIQAQP